jgi:hypothetical protein
MSTLKAKPSKIVSHREFEWIWTIPNFELLRPYAAAFSFDDGKIKL